MRSLVLSLSVVFLSLTSAYTQIPVNIGIHILKAEDARRYDSVLENLMKSPVPAIRARAALAVGRIGDERAVPALAVLLGLDQPDEVQEMAAFALGEIESIKGAEPIFMRWNAHEGDRPSISGEASKYSIRPRLVEAAGKIAAANPNDPKSKDLSNAILRQLWELEQARANREWILLGLTAVLRTKPQGADEVVAKFLTHPDPRVRADAANTLARLKAKNANETLRHMLAGDTDAVARANAASALGVAEDGEALDLLINAAANDKDGRVRVAAIRAVARLKNAKAADPLLDRGNQLLAAYKRSGSANPVEKNEMIEIAVALGRLVPKTMNERAVKLLREFGALDKGLTPEFSIALVRLEAPRRDDDKKPEIKNWHQYSTLAQILGEFALIDATTDEAKKIKQDAPGILRTIIEAFLTDDRNKTPDPENKVYAAPDYLRAYAQFKTADLPEIARKDLEHSDVFVRAAAAEIIGDQPSSKENVEALKKAFDRAMLTDKEYDDAQLAILDALVKLDKRAAVDTLIKALGAPDYLVRKKAFDLLKDADRQNDPVLEKARSKGITVLPYNPASGTKLGQILNTDADYRRALSRKNGTAKAVLNTQVGIFTIDLLPEDAPLTVDNFIKLARSGYFNGVEVHRVVPNFVMQDGDPRGDGNGGPGWSIRCEINMVPYDRGAVGMALSGKDTGGSQWFVTHSPQPHLDGGYTVFGKVNETDMKVVDNISRGDKILSVRIEEVSPRKDAKKRKK